MFPLTKSQSPVNFGAYTSAPVQPVGQRTDPEAFKSMIIAKHPDGVASDGRKYSAIPAQELTQKIVDKFPDGVTNDGRKYSAFLSPVAVQAPPQIHDITKGALDVGTSIFSSVKDAFKGGINQIAQGHEQAQAATNPVQLLEAGLQGGAGLFNAAAAPLAPLFKPLGTAITSVGDKIGDSPAVQRFATSKAGLATDRVAGDVNNAATIAGGVTSLFSPKKLATETSSLASKLDTRVAAPELAKQQVTKLAQEWKAPSLVNKATYATAKKVLDKSPDTTTFLAEQKIDPAAYVKNGNYDTLELAQHFQDTAGKLSEEVLVPSLKAADYATEITPAHTLVSSAKRYLNNTYNTIPDAAENIGGLIDQKIAALDRKYPNGMLLSQMGEESIAYGKEGGFSPIKDPAVNNAATANRAIRDALVKMIEDKAPKDLPVGQFRSYLSKYYRAADYLEALNNKLAPASLGKKTMRLASKTSGALLGGSLPGGMVTALAGYSIGNAIEHALENLTGPARTAFIDNISKTNPEAYVKVQQYLKTANSAANGRALLNAPPEIPKVIRLGEGRTSITPPVARTGESKVTLVPAQKNPVSLNPKTNRFQTSYSSEAVVPAPKSIPSAAATVERHIQNAQQVMSNLPKAELERLGGEKAAIQRLKTNLVDGLKKEGNAELSSMISKLRLNDFDKLNTFMMTVRDLAKYFSVQ